MSILGNASTVSFEDLSFNSNVSNDEREFESRKQHLFRSRSTNDYQTKSGEQRRQLAYELEQEQKISADVDAILERHRRGDHIFVNSAKLEHEDLGREEGLYRDAVTTFRMDKHTYEYKEDVHGRIPLKHTKEHVDEVKTRELYIDKNKDLIECMDIYWSEKKKLKELLSQISDNNADIADITAEAEEEKLNHPFEWQLQLNNKIFALDRDNERLHMELEICRTKVRDLINNNRDMFKELEKADLALFFDEEAVNEMEDVAESMINEDKVQVYAWIIGRLNTREIVSNMIFGQFTTEKEPPKHGWIFCGRNITANVTESKGLYADSIIGQDEAIEDRKINAKIANTLDAMSSTTTEEAEFTEGHDSYHDTPVYPDIPGAFTEPPILKRDGSIEYANPHLRTRAGTGWLSTLREDDVSYTEDDSNVNLLNTATFGTNTENPDSFAAKNTQTWTDLNSFIVDDATMDSMVNDQLTVEPTEGISIMEGPFDKKIKMDYSMQYISGCSFNDVNGKYLEWGRSAMALRYRNPKGWVLLRLSLSEIPELGIKAENCYGALDGEPVLDIMERKTASAYEDILDEEKNIAEGSMTFKEKFAEISRFGSRIVNYDQTFQLLRNNDLKANVRTAASRAMLLQLLALKSNAEKEKKDEEESAPQESPGGSPTVHSTDETDSHDQSSSHDKIATGAAEVKEGVDIDIETTLSRNTMYQTGSQGMLISKDPKFLARESELTREATMRIEIREKLLSEVSLEAERIHRTFVESHEVDVHNKNFVLISDLLRKIDDLREASINVAEVIGAWIRLCHKQKKGKPVESVADKSTAKPPREYSVAIAVKGVELYPPSEAIASGVKKYRRGREESKVAIDVKYVGLFKKKQAAIDAFSSACSKVPLEKRAFVYGDQPPMYIGLRECGKHYLVRSDGVPSDLPCEQCQANSFGKPNDIVKASEPDMLPQFLWHGKNYIEKMWADFDFLDKSAPLKKYFPGFRIKGNPLLLDVQSYFESLESIGVGVANPFDTLKGKIEQVQDAVDEATRQPPAANPYTFMGTPYVENFVKTIMKQKSAEYAWLRKEKERLRQESIERGVVPAPPLPVDNGEFDYARLHSTLENDLFTLEKTSTLNSQSGLSYENEGRDKFRVNRALAVLCQSSSVTVNTLTDEAKTDRLNLSILKQRPLKRPTLPSEIKKKIAEGLSYKASKDMTEFGPTLESNGVAERYPDAGIKGDFVKTKTNYAYRGAKLSTIQNRPPLANRTDEIWCRTDVGEWKGLSKGRNMRSYEFQEKMKEISKALIAERLRMQGVIRKALEIHFADLDQYGGVPYIRGLITEAAAIRGTALKLDIAQAELYIQKRKMVIKKMTSIKARFHGVKARRHVKEILRKLRWEKEQIRLTEELSYDMAREVVIPLIADCVQRVTAEFKKIQFKSVVNISGDVYVVTVFKMSRNARRNQVKDLVCEACMSKSSTKVYSPKLHMVPSGVVPNACGSDTSPGQGEIFLLQGTYGSRRAVCTCAMVQERERVLFKLYNPVTKETFSHLLTEKQIRENIHFADVVRNITIEERRVRLVGDSFGELAPVFASREELRRNVYTKTEMAKGLFAASRESSILPLLPRHIPADLLKAVDCLIRVRPEILKEFYNIESTRGPINVANTQDDHAIRELTNSQHWEIFHNVEYPKKQLRRVEHELKVRQERARNSNDEFNHFSDLEIHAREEHDRAGMRFEDIRMQAINAFDKLMDAKKQLVDVVSFSKYGLEKFTAEEMNISEDWTQSYDGLEDANAWKSLNHQRRLQSIVRDIEKVYVERYYKSRETEPVLLEAIERKIAQCIVKERDKEFAIEYLPTLGLIKGLCKAMEDTLEGLTKIALCPYYIPYSPMCKKRPKYLRKQNINGVYIRDPMVRCQVEHRYLWKLIEKRVIGIKTSESPFAKGKTIRVVACYYVDPLTGNNLLSLLTEDPILFEECTMHLDFQFTMSEFSEAIYTGEDKEMLLKPHNVEDFVKRGLDEVHVRIKPPVPKPVWLPRKGKDGEKRLRTVDYVKICRAADDRLAQMPKSYSNRRKFLDDKLYKDSTKILSSLRLNPYSRRPCLGRLYFDRRLRFIQPIIQKTMWLNNLINQDCVTWNNEFYENLHFFCGNIVHVVIRNVWDKFEFRITMPGITPLTILYVLSFESIVESFSLKPLLLMSFFSELMTNTFSYDSICHILQHIDVTLPGENRPEGGSVSKFMWRKRLEDNIPEILYITDEGARFRGPVYRCYRFMSGFYVLCIVYKSAYDDFRMVIKEPMDGNYVKDKYPGDDIVIDMDWNQILSFCLLLPSRRMHDMSIEDALKLLYPHNWEELFKSIFDCISINKNPQEVPVTSLVPTLTDLENHRLIHKQLNTFSSKNPDAKWTHLPVVHDKDYVSSRFRLFIKKFERWASLRTNGKIQQIPENIVNGLIRSVDTLGHPESKFAFLCAKEEKSIEKLIKVFQGTWCAPTPLDCVKYEDRNTYDDPPILDIPILSRKDLSYLLFTIFTDDTRDKIYVKVRTSQLNGKKVELEESILETEGMLEADEESRTVEEFISDQEERKVMKAFFKLNSDGYEVESKKLVVERRKIENMQSMIHEEASKMDDLCSRWVEDSKNTSSAYVFSKLLTMTDHFTSFLPSDDIVRDMKAILDDVIFAVTDTPRCALCKTTFKNYKKLEFHMKSKSGSHSESLLKLHEARLAPKLVKLEREHSFKRRNAHASKKKMIGRLIRQKALEIEEEKDGTGEYEGYPPITPAAAAEEAAEFFRPQLEAEYEAIEEAMNKDLEIERNRLIERHQADSKSVNNYPVCPTIDFTPSEVHAFNKGLDDVRARFQRQAQVHSHDKIHILDMGPAEAVIGRYTFKRSNHCNVRPRSTTTASSRAEITASQQHLRPTYGVANTKPENFRSYNSWISIKRNVSIALERKSRNGCMALNHIVSEPKFGPYDIFSLEFYNPITRMKFSRIFLPPCGLYDIFRDNISADDSQKKSNEDLDDSSSVMTAESSVITATEISSIERACAIRLTSFAILNATVSVAAQLTCEKLGDMLLESEDIVQKYWRNINGCIDQDDYETFKRNMVVEKPKVSKEERQRRNTVLIKGLAVHEAQRAFGVFVPLDEEETPTIFRCDPSEDWLHACSQYLGPTTREGRLKSLPSFIYTRTEGAYVREYKSGKKIFVHNHVNKRVLEWVKEFTENNGWRINDDEVSNMILRKKGEEKHDEDLSFSSFGVLNCAGDAVLIMRFGEQDATNLLEWCKKRYERDQPIRDAVREKELMKRNRMKDSHKEWRNFLFDFARPFVAPIEELCAVGYRRSKNYGSHQYDVDSTATTTKVTPYYGRLLLSEYCYCIDDPKYSQFREDTFLVDSDVGVDVEENLLRFENFERPEFVDPGEVFLKQHDLQKNLRPTVLQVMYAVLIMHCTECQASPGACKFLGCHLFKTSRCYEIPEDFGTGKHIVEITCREYMMSRGTAKELKSRFVTATKIPDAGPDPDLSDDEDEKEANEIERLRILEEVTCLKWRDLQAEGAEFRYLNRRICRQEVNKVVPRETYISTLSGEHFEDERQIPLYRQAALNTAIDHMQSVADEHRKNEIETKLSENTDDSGSTTLMEIPLKTFRMICGKFAGPARRDTCMSTHDKYHNYGFQSFVTSKIDPYPPEDPNAPDDDGDESTYPMKKSLFDWLCERLSISQCVSLKGGQHLIGDINFDRLIGEKVVRVNRSNPYNKESLGDVVIIQILYGRIPGLLSTGPRNGYPDAAVRHYNVTRLHELEEGITISVYDTVSHFSRAMCFEPNTLKLWTAQLDLGEFEIATLAAELLRQASEIFQIVRAGKLFHALIIDPNRVSTLSSTFKKDDDKISRRRLKLEDEIVEDSEEDTEDDTDSDDDAGCEPFSNKTLRTGRRQLVDEYSSSMGMYELLKAEGKL